jgi:hypothetical protein
MSGIAAVDRALSVLRAFRADDRTLTLTELAGRTAQGEIAGVRKNPRARG